MSIARIETRRTGLALKSVWAEQRPGRTELERAYVMTQHVNFADGNPPDGVSVQVRMVRARAGQNRATRTETRRTGLAFKSVWSEQRPGRTELVRAYGMTQHVNHADGNPPDGMETRRTALAFSSVWSEHGPGRIKLESDYVMTQHVNRVDGNPSDSLLLPPAIIPSGSAIANCGVVAPIWPVSGACAAAVNCGAVVSPLLPIAAWWSRDHTFGLGCRQLRRGRVTTTANCGMVVPIWPLSGSCAAVVNCGAARVTTVAKCGMVVTSLRHPAPITSGSAVVNCGAVGRPPLPIAAWWS
ncbi:hypothetical protein FIBSPDRAFT_886324 [Athelia psychrophila]|uniref:Uncharacterized protein n=1 Tax=Athelia psychrophila TaxID=1759441 RepID=A0A166R0U0_9AGAM|nr:hypothetical protein FIBSPDRAFT_886324 [Fibularhizoctonia sp. CBS 109695]